MQTKLIKTNDSNINETALLAGEILRNGGIVAIPTETVYGLAANALSGEAVKKIFEAKGRPQDNPLIVHVTDISEVTPLVKSIPDEARRLAERFWPGPLTMIMPKSDLIPDETSGGLSTVAVRCPSHPVARAIIRAAGVPLAAPSANVSGRPSPTNAKYVFEDMNGKIDMIVDGGQSEVGVESTVVTLAQKPARLLRPGGITAEQLKSVLGEVVIDDAVLHMLKSGEKAASPGMKYKHYAPDADLKIVEGDMAKVVDYINDNTKKLINEGFKVAIMTTDETRHFYTDGIVISMGHKSDELSVARHLYAILREFDNEHVDYVFSESFETENVGRAVMNRLIKAAGHTIIHV